MLVLNFIPLAAGYLLKCYKFHKQGFGEAWDKGMHEAFALLKEGRLGKRPFRWRDLPHYLLPSRLTPCHLPQRGRLSQKKKDTRL